jgi:DHA2 family multidrug resistance protein-like MFS transporter
VVGYLLLAQLGHTPYGVGLVTAAFALVYLGLGTIAALGTDLVVSAAPAEKAGTASALSEVVQELGLAVGIATLGSLTTAVYRIEMAGQTLIPGEIGDRLSDSLAGAVSVATELPAGMLEQAQAAFMTGFNAAAAVCAVAIAIMATLAVVSLRRRVGEKARS